MQNMLNPAMRKGMSYAHESELRAITLYVPEPYDPTEALPTGINIGPINLDVLIEGVYVSPGCAEWIKELTQKIMDKYKLKKPLESSDLDNRPDLT